MIWPMTVLAFGEWVKQIRLTQGSRLARVGGDGGIDASTVSRVERGQTQATLPTALALCQALHVSFGEYVRLALPDLPDPALAVATGAWTWADMTPFLDLYAAHPARAATLFCDWVNPLLPAGSPPWGPAAALRLWQPSPLYHFGLFYPPILNHRKIVEMVHAGGVTLADDVRPLVDLVDGTALSARGQDALRRLRVTPILSAKVDDLIAVLPWVPALLPVSLAAVDGEARIGPFPPARPLLLLLRWWMDREPDTTWLTQVRSDLQKAIR